MCRCPRCGEGSVYDGFLSLKEECDCCNLPIAENDNGDGPAVFLIFIFGFLLVPLALWVDFRFEPPLWFHVILWSVVGFGLTILALRPTKAYVMALIYFHRQDLWNDKADQEKDQNKGAS